MTRPGARLLAAAATLAAIPVLAACAGAPAGDGGGGPTTGDGPALEEVPPSQLVGLWRVDAEGESEDTWVQIGSPYSPHDLTLWRECGAISGWWLPGAGAMLTSIESWSGACGDDAGGVDWLLAVDGFAADGEDRVLLDAEGEVLATLSLDGEPPPHPDVADELRTQPELTEEQAAELDVRPEPLPDGAEPAAAEEVLGRWVPVETYETDPFIELLDDGTWTGSDGCNGLGGRWLLDDELVLLVISGPQTLIGCEGENLGSMLVGSAWLVVDGDTLTFYDAEGTVIGEAARG